MRPGQQKNRMRGRGRKGPNPLSRSYESNGPDVKIRGNAQHIADKYSQLARDATSSGDRVMAENYFQHAEHYYRIIAAAQPQQSQRDDRDGRDEDDDDGDSRSYQSDRFDRDESSGNDRNNDRGERQDRSRDDRSRDDRNNRRHRDRYEDRSRRSQDDERHAPNGTGPQPVIQHDMPSTETVYARNGSHAEARADRNEDGAGEEISEARSDDQSQSDGASTEDAPRRKRGRPRKNPEAAGEGSTSAQERQASTDADDDGAAKPKRKPGRPRKKMADASSDGDNTPAGDHMPDFLLASNG